MKFALKMRSGVPNIAARESGYLSSARTSFLDDLRSSPVDVYPDQIMDPNPQREMTRMGPRYHQARANSTEAHSSSERMCTPGVTPSAISSLGGARCYSAKRLFVSRQHLDDEAA